MLGHIASHGLVLFLLGVLIALVALAAEAMRVKWHVQVRTVSS